MRFLTTFKTDSTFNWPSDYDYELGRAKREREPSLEEIIPDIEECYTPLKDTTTSRNIIEIPPSRKKSKQRQIEHLEQRFQNSLTIHPKLSTNIQLGKISVAQSCFNIILDIASFLQKESIRYPLEGIVFFESESQEFLISKKVQIASVANDHKLIQAVQKALQTIQQIFEDAKVCKYYLKGCKKPIVFRSSAHTAIRGVLHSINAVSCEINFTHDEKNKKLKLLEIPIEQEEK